MMYLVKTPQWARLLLKGCTWSIKTSEKQLFLTFDDGPHPVVTPFVLDTLQKANAKATFFCIGKNVAAYPAIYQRIIDEGHAVGNHTFDHLNGWKSADDAYLDNIAAAAEYIDSNLFRPPYGRITRFQLKQLAAPRFKLNAVMWTLLSGDFDTRLSPAKCLENVLLHGSAGSIVVFHDSEKAFEKLKIVLPGTLRYFAEKGYQFEKIVL
jgi:peptidoglycan/xylan/chitin deacetylase (PgdA/CDA1 family)